MKFIFKLSVWLLIFGTFACTKNFETINTNPNAPVEIQPSLLLRQVIYDMGEKMSYEGFVAGDLLSQHFTMIDFNLFDRHNLRQPQLGGNPWPVLYQNLRDNETILTFASENPVFEVYKGPSLILKAYITMILTDLYGDVPYSQALKAKSGNVSPAYDSQELIYTGTDGILDNLNKGIAAIAAYKGTAGLAGDIFYGGNLSNWVALAQSLKIKALMRISNTRDVSLDLQAIVASDNFIKSNSQNAVFAFTDAPPNNFRIATARVGDYNLYIMSTTFESILKNYDDPRMATFFKTTSKNDTVYKGLPNGPDASQTSITLAEYSLTGKIFREKTSLLKANFMTAWETNFLLADAANRGLIAGSAQTYYETGVTQAFEYWNTTMPIDYLTTGLAAFGNDTIQKQIITQKWIASVVNGYEGWIEWRRTGFPAIVPATGSLNNGLVPVRMPYPTDEEALNSTNFGLASANTNGNSINAKVWWDTN